MKIIAPVLFVWVMALCLQSAIAAVDETTSPQVVIGKDDRLAVSEIFDQLPANLQVAALASGHIGLFCTVTHLGNGLAVTAGHCFLEKQLLIQDQPCGNIPVVWGPGLGPRREVRGVCKKIIIARISPKTRADYAFIEVEGYPEQKLNFNWAGIIQSSGTLTIFSKAGGKPYQWSRFCKPLKPWSWTSESPNLYHHSCDTQPGSSGGAILTYSKNELPQIVGIHFGGDRIAQRNTATNPTAIPRSIVNHLSQKYGLVK